MHIHKPKDIFVCSMADLFGDWVPDEWIKDVFEACAAAPQHRYLFLTKNPQRYGKINVSGRLPFSDNYWFGVTAETHLKYTANFNVGDITRNYFVSLEPLQSAINIHACNGWFPRWVIIGAETGGRSGKVVPERSWVQNIVGACRETNIPVFMKDSLASVWRQTLIREFPWEVET
jgi:protein gp37